MSTHTKGPWFVGAQNDALFVIDRPPAHFTDNPLPEGGSTVVIASVSMLTHPTAQANANVLAAAPELLEALKKLTSEVSGLMGAPEFRSLIGNTNFEVLRMRWERARAVISQAELLYISDEDIRTGRNIEKGWQ